MDSLTHAAELRERAENLRAADNSGATAAYQRAVSLLRLKLAHTIRHLADVHVEGGRADEALPLFEEAVAIYRAHPSPDPLDLANAIRPLALLTGNAALWEEARELYRQRNIPAGVAEAERQIAELRRSG